MDATPKSDVMAMVNLCRQHLLQVVQMQGPILRMLVEQKDEELPMEFGELLDDAANVYLDAAEKISERFVESLRAKHSQYAQKTSALRNRA
jgi:hypothetical protein